MFGDVLSSQITLSSPSITQLGLCCFHPGLFCALTFDWVVHPAPPLDVTMWWHTDWQTVGLTVFFAPLLCKQLRGSILSQRLWCTFCLSVFLFEPNTLHSFLGSRYLSYALKHVWCDHLRMCAETLNLYRSLNFVNFVEVLLPLGPKLYFHFLRVIEYYLAPRFNPTCQRFWAKDQHIRKGGALNQTRHA